MPSPMSTDTSLDKIFLDCLKYNICTQEDILHLNLYNSKIIRFSKFAAMVYSHDTGNDVKVWVIHPDGETLLILEGTYWFFSHYCFNSFFRLHGIWDIEFGRELNNLRELIQNKKDMDNEVIQSIKKFQEKEEQSTLEKFRSLFH